MRVPLHQLPSIHISEDNQRENPTIKFNNHLNPELVHSKFLIFIVILLMIGMIPFYWLYFSKKTSTIQLLEHLFELGFPQALIFVSGSLYPYITNKSLQKFITEYFKRQIVPISNSILKVKTCSIDEIDSIYQENVTNVYMSSISFVEQIFSNETLF